MSDSARRVLLSFGVMPIVVGGHLITSVYLDDVLDGSLAVLDLGSELVGVAAIAVILGAIWMSRHVSSKWGWVEGCTVVFAVAYVGVIARSALYTSDEDTAMLALANAIWAPLACLLWVLIWRSVVHWSWTTRVRTCLAATVFLCLAMTAPYLPEDPEISSAVRWLLPLIVWGGWMIATMLLWRFREAALPDRVEECLRCPSCAYSLKGLYGTRCPECGEEPTLDELVTGVLGVDDA